MAYQEIKSGKLKKFEKAGDYIEGYFMGERNGKTKYGDAVFLDFKGEGEDNFCIVKTSGMIADWDNLLGVKVKIQYTGDVENPKTGRTFKNYKIFADYEDVCVPF